MRLCCFFLVFFGFFLASWFILPYIYTLWSPLPGSPESLACHFYFSHFFCFRVRSVWKPLWGFLFLISSAQTSFQEYYRIVRLLSAEKRNICSGKTMAGMKGSIHFWELLAPLTVWSYYKIAALQQFQSFFPPLFLHLANVVFLILVITFRDFWTLYFNFLKNYYSSEDLQMFRKESREDKFRSTLRCKYAIHLLKDKLQKTNIKIGSGSGRNFVCGPQSIEKMYPDKTESLQPC